VLGCPYGGDRSGKDTYGTYFSTKTNFMLDVGDVRPVIYYHGIKPDSSGLEEMPEVIGKAIVDKRDEDGLWFRVILNKASSLAKRIWEARSKGDCKSIFWSFIPFD